MELINLEKGLERIDRIKSRPLKSILAFIYASVYMIAIGLVGITAIALIRGLFKAAMRLF